MNYADSVPVGSDGVTLGWQPPANLLAQAVVAAKKAPVAVVFASDQVSVDVTNTGPRWG